jgi:hypothetical protein
MMRFVSPLGLWHRPLANVPWAGCPCHVTLAEFGKRQLEDARS